MADTPRIDGTPDPRKSSQLSSDDPIDTEKFKRMLKVEDTDETQKQHKRRKPKKTEEEDELESEEALRNTPKDARFASIFGAGKASEDIFAKKVEEKPTLQVKGSDFQAPDIVLKIDKKSPKIFPTLNLQDALPNAFIHSSGKIILKGSENLSLTELPTIQTPSPVNNLPPPEKEPEGKDKLSIKEEEAQIAQSVFQPDISQPLLTGPPLLTTESPAYTGLSPEVFDLYEKMIGLLMIEELKGVSITTIKLSMPGSVFNNCEIKLEHFDTAPHSFNIQLLGNPLAVDLFNANYSKLVASFAEGNYKFQANIRRPILLESYHKLTKKNLAQEETTQDETAI
jgi:hypothetical protein